MSKIKVDKHDYLRVILTETLPYEVPITFLNEGLYFYLKEFNDHSHFYVEGNKDSHIFIGKFFNYSKYTKPYNYRINKNSNSKRLLSVPHPSIQRQISDFYKKYDSVITGLCSKSPVSLRAPSHVASRYYEKELATYEKSPEEKNVETEREGFENTSVYASSYFTYRKYNFLYKFYDSYESHRIEKKFEHLTRFDISKCFHNIYIPTLSWAVKSQDFSKKYSSSYSFEGNFQELMKNTNNLDTSGIIVGPEISRIYAEIILQDLDLKIIERLRIERNLNFDVDYTLRRYVDDYFFYTKKPESSINALPLIKDELEKYKLFINESKTENLEVPFITGLTIAKMDCKDLIFNLFTRFVKEDCENYEDISFMSFHGSPARESNRL
ncbi:MAG: antiviral reverse transcriptase Drt3b, partial [Bacilli bacterium]